MPWASFARVLPVQGAISSASSGVFGPRGSASGIVVTTLSPRERHQAPDMLGRRAEAAVRLGGGVAHDGDELVPPGQRRRRGEELLIGAVGAAERQPQPFLLHLSPPPSSRSAQDLRAHQLRRCPGRAAPGQAGRADRAQPHVLRRCPVKAARGRGQLQQQRVLAQAAEHRVREHPGGHGVHHKVAQPQKLRQRGIVRRGAAQALASARAVRGAAPRPSPVRPAPAAAGPAPADPPQPQTARGCPAASARSPAAEPTAPSAVTAALPSRSAGGPSDPAPSAPLGAARQALSSLRSPRRQQLPRPGVSISSSIGQGSAANGAFSSPLFSAGTGSTTQSAP